MSRLIGQTPASSVEETNLVHQPQDVARGHAVAIVLETRQSLDGTTNFCRPKRGYFGSLREACVERDLRGLSQRERLKHHEWICGK